MAIKFPHAAFQRKPNSHTHTVTHADMWMASHLQSNKCAAKISSWMHFEHGTATPTSTHSVKGGGGECPTQLCPLLKTWACEYVNFSLVCWFRPIWEASVRPPSPAPSCTPAASPTPALPLPFPSSTLLEMIVRFLNEIGARLWRRLCHRNVETIIRIGLRRRGKKGAGEGEGSWTICSLKQTCTKKARGLNSTHFICKYRKYNITHGTRTRPQRARRESQSQSQSQSRCQCQSRQRCWVPSAGDRRRFAGKLVSPQRPVNYHNTQGARCLHRAGTGVGEGQGSFEPGHNNRL